jgi:hypothetical protein
VDSDSAVKATLLTWVPGLAEEAATATR